jgi:hypothetical protein
VEVVVVVVVVYSSLITFTISIKKRIQKLSRETPLKIFKKLFNKHLGLVTGHVG